MAQRSAPLLSRYALLWFQQRAGNRAVNGLVGPARGSSPGRGASRKTDKAQAEELDELTVEGVIAFEELAKWTAPSAEAVPGIPAETPGGLRPALGRLQRAKQMRYGAGMPTAEEEVLARLAPEGPVGLGKWFLFGPQLTLRTRLERATTAKAEWQAARPVVDALVKRYAGMNGANPVFAAEYRQMIASLDREMTERIATLHLELAELLSPEQARLAMTISEADTTVSTIGEVLAKAAPFTTAVSHAKTGISTAGTGTDVKSSGLPGAGPLDSALKKYATVKALIDSVKSSDDLSQAAEKITRSGGGLAGDIQRDKGIVDASKILVDMVKDVAKPAFEGAAWAYEVYADSLLDSAALPRWKDTYVDVARRANGLRTVAEALSKLEKPSAILGIASGALGVMEGLSANDAEATLMSALDVTGGVLELAAPAAAIPLNIGLVQLKVMIYVVGQMSRARRAIRNAAMREALEQIEKNLNTAVRAGQTFDLAFGQWAVLQGASDPVDRALGNRYREKTLGAVAPLHNSIAAAISSGVQGPVRKYPVFADAFAMAFGGYDVALATLFNLKDGIGSVTAGTLMSHASYLNNEVLGTLAEAVRDLTVTMNALEAESGWAMKFSETPRNTLRVNTRVSFSRGAMRVDLDKLVLDGPIQGEAYRLWLAEKFHDKTLGELKVIRVHIDANVLNLGASGRLWESVKMHGAGSSMSKHSEISDPSAKLIAGSASSGSAAKALWDAHMSKVKVSKGATLS